MKSISFVIGSVSILFLAATPCLAAAPTADDALTDAQLKLGKQYILSVKADQDGANKHRLPADDVVRLYEEVLKDEAHGDGIMAASIKLKSGPALANAIKALNKASVEDIEHKTKNGLSAMDVLIKLNDSKLAPPLKQKFAASLSGAHDMIVAIKAEKTLHGSGKIQFADAFKADPKTSLLSTALDKVRAAQKIQVAIDKEDSRSPINPEQLGIDKATYNQAYRSYITAARSVEDKATALDTKNPDPTAVIDLAADYDAAQKAHDALSKLVDVPKTK